MGRQRLHVAITRVQTQTFVLLGASLGRRYSFVWHVRPVLRQLHASLLDTFPTDTVGILSTLLGYPELEPEEEATLAE